MKNDLVLLLVGFCCIFAKMVKMIILFAWVILLLLFDRLKSIWKSDQIRLAGTIIDKYFSAIWWNYQATHAMHLTLMIVSFMIRFIYPTIWLKSQNRVDLITRKNKNYIKQIDWQRKHKHKWYETLSCWVYIEIVARDKTEIPKTEIIFILWHKMCFYWCPCEHLVIIIISFESTLFLLLVRKKVCGAQM